MKWLIGIVIAIGAFTVPVSWAAQSCTGIIVPAGANVQAFVDDNPDGALFCLQAGTYARQSITPKDGQQFIANGAVTFDGGGVTEVAFNGVLEPNNAARNRERVVIRGITFTGYRTASWQGKSVLIPSEGWVIENVVIRDSTSGIRGGNVNWTCANDFILRDVLIENVSHAALYWNATYGLSERLTVRNSGYELSRANADYYGIVKYQNQPIWANGGFTSTTPCPVQAGRQLIVRDSTFDNLNGVGWWCDINCRDVVFRRNVVTNNQWSGFMFEISGGGHTGATSNIIEGNTFACNRRSNIGGGGWGGAEIFVPNANGIIIRDNDITVCEGGRAFSLVYESHRRVPTRDILIENNTIRMQPGATHITITCCDGGWANGANIVFRANTYRVANTGAAYFEWLGRALTWQGWQGVSMDTSTFIALDSAATITVSPTLSLTPTATNATPVPTFATTATPAPQVGCFQIAAVDSRVLLIPVECPQVP